jgi:hypothetical protein
MVVIQQNLEAACTFVLLSLAILLFSYTPRAQASVHAATANVFNETKQLDYINLTWAAHCNPQVLANWSCFWCTDSTVRYASQTASLATLNSR